MQRKMTNLIKGKTKYIHYKKEMWGPPHLCETPNSTLANSALFFYKTTTTDQESFRGKTEDAKRFERDPEIYNLGCVIMAMLKVISPCSPSSFAFLPSKRGTFFLFFLVLLHSLKLFCMFHSHSLRSW